MPTRETLTVREVAQRLGIHVSTVWRWIREDRLPCLRVHRKVLVPTKVIDRLLGVGEEPND